MMFWQGWFDNDGIWHGRTWTDGWGMTTAE
jgi:hypothetical protein